jgi:hypothetical protein
MGSLTHSSSSHSKNVVAIAPPQSWLASIACIAAYQCQRLIRWGNGLPFSLTLPVAVVLAPLQFLREGHW